MPPFLHSVVNEGWGFFKKNGNWALWKVLCRRQEVRRQLRGRWDERRPPQQKALCGAFRFTGGPAWAAPQEGPWCCQLWKGTEAPLGWPLTPTTQGGWGTTWSPSFGSDCPLHSGGRWHLSSAWDRPRRAFASSSRDAETKAWVGSSPAAWLVPGAHCPAWRLLFSRLPVDAQPLSRLLWGHGSHFNGSNEPPSLCSCQRCRQHQSSLLTALPGASPKACSLLFSPFFPLFSKAFSST